MIEPDDLRAIFALSPTDLRRKAELIERMPVKPPPGTWRPENLRLIANMLDDAHDVRSDEAMVAAAAILSVLHYRGLDDTEDNQAEVAHALAMIAPYANEAERRLVERHHRERREIP